MTPVLVIGAGPAGLAAAALQSRDVPFDVVDAGRCVGGIWDVARRDTPMYDTAHFISSKTLSAFPDFPFPDDYPDYPHHAEILAYIQDFARHHDLEKHIEFGVRVTRARHEDGGWSVEMDSGEVRSYEDLCVATGANWHPRLPEYPGGFEGEAYHAFHYTSPDELRGKRVLVVGGGNSGCDLACDAAHAADKAFLSLRRGYHFVPKYVFGQPSDVFAHGGPLLPPWLEERLFGFLIGRVLVGDLTRLGLPRPDHPILASHPIMNTEVLHHIGHGSLTPVPDVRELRAGSVVFADGREEEVDLIVWATGYRRVFPFLNAEDAEDAGDAGDAEQAEGRENAENAEVTEDAADAEDAGNAEDTDSTSHEVAPPDLYLNLLHRRYPGLSFMGLFETDGAAFPLLGLQAALVAGYASVRQRGDDTSALDALRKSARPDLHGGRRYLSSARHAYYVREATYRKLLTKTLKRLWG